MNSIAKKDMIKGSLGILLALGLHYNHPSFLTPQFRVIIMIIVFSIGCAYLFCVLIKGNQDEYDYVHGVNE